MNRRNFALGAAGVGLCAAAVEADEPPYIDRLRARIAAPIPSAWDFAAGWTLADKLDTAGGVAHVTQIAAFASAPMTGLKISTLIHFIVSRIGGDGTDTYTADARMLEFDIHYQKDSDGSHAEYLK